MALLLRSTRVPPGHEVPGTHCSFYNSLHLHHSLMWSVCCHSHFSDEETEARRSKVTPPARVWLGFENRKCGEVGLVTTVPAASCAENAAPVSCVSGLVRTGLTGYASPGLCQYDILLLNGAFWRSGLDPGSHEKEVPVTSLVPP